MQQLNEYPPPVIIGGGNSGTSVSSVEDIQEALANGASKIRLAKDITLDKDLSIGDGVTIDGRNNSFIANPRTAGSEDAQLVISGDGVVLSNITIKVSDVSRSSDPAQGATDKNGFALLVVNASNVTLENVTLTTNNLTSGLNVYNSKKVMIKNLTVDNCQRAPINISASEVTIDGATAAGSAWYGDLNVIQVNGLGGSMHDQDSTINPKSSTVTISNMGNFDAVWQEVVAEDYAAAGSINAITAEGQSSVTLDGGVSLLIDQPNDRKKGWMIVPGANLLNIQEFDENNYKVLTDGHYRIAGSTDYDVREITAGALNMGSSDTSHGNGIGYYFGTTGSMTIGNEQQKFENIVDSGDIYIMQMSYSNLTGPLSVGGNMHAVSGQPESSSDGIYLIQSPEEGTVVVLMLVQDNVTVTDPVSGTFDTVTYYVLGQSAPKTILTNAGTDFRCGFTAWGNCLVNSIRVDKLNLDASKLAGLMGN